ncbi:M23/M56 family metallopeptidase [Aquimarina sediminis]|uniref:M23/M56 family metallopeptidase n=1 Tax=Aquimarina sediminis TaxID=2070536 RepID=UPI0013E8EA52|nr:M23/M56 family metallopeptidase [Aquimarina sediminis]
MATIPLSILIPLTNSILPSTPHSIIEVPQLFEKVNQSSHTTYNSAIQPVLDDVSTNYFYFFIILYWIGALFSLFRLFVANKKLIVLKRKAKIYQQNGFKILVANVPDIFSYFNWIFIPEKKHEKYDELIIAHEKAHIQLKHSIDLVITELFIALFWFNPVMYFYRKSLKSIHEFQADHKVLKNKVKTSVYMQLLLQTITAEKPNNLYSYFNHPILLKRIKMMTKTKSNNLAKLKYFLLLPICVLFLIAFTKPTTKNTFINKAVETVDIFEIKNTPPSIFPVQNGSIKDITSTYGPSAKRPKMSTEKNHGGIDIKAKIGTPVIATADGVISKASLEGNWGNLIVISHPDGYETWYAHLQSFNCKETQDIKKGEVIGYVGNTGLSSGPHLHYEVKLNGNRVNPINYIQN